MHQLAKKSWTRYLLFCGDENDHGALGSSENRYA